MPSDKGGSTATKSWTPAVLVKRPDNIISSDYARDSRVFIPSYERECRPCMDQLIANEYQRIWWEERDAWEQHRPGKSDKDRAKKEPRAKTGVESSSRKAAIGKSSTRKNIASTEGNKGGKVNGAEASRTRDKQKRVK